ncbi:FAS1 domain-containing protein SELMODRAFT_448915-like [Rutidosis leptorrhynchoides]|uniref:FAS1 domain-containing protein SELMODRAFT_448915-like n=1 Tax=Rutidosis leptorrhynchoides TaxID=125765 RepID=UPI003A995B66
MANYVKIYVSVLIITFMISSMAYAVSNITRNNDIEVAIEEMERANYFTFVMLINMVPSDLFQGGVTFLVPSDESLSRITMPPNNVTDLLLRHSIPSPLLFDHLLHLPTNSMLPTSNPELMVKVFNSGRMGLFLGNVRIVSPNVCTHGDSVRCHGIDRVLNVDDEQYGPTSSISCPRIVAPIPAPAPSLAPPGLVPTFDPPQSETSSGGTPHVGLELAFMSYLWVLYSISVSLV